MTKKEILEYLECIDDALTDAYNTAHEGEINGDSIYYMDTAKDLMSELVHNIENNINKNNHGRPVTKFFFRDQFGKPH